MKYLIKLVDEFSLFVIKIYKIVFSPLLGNNCRYIPSCSDYSIDVIKKFGFISGAPYIIKRILSCHPFGKSGFDPIPMLKKKVKVGELSISEIRLVRNQVLYKNLSQSFSVYPEDLFISTLHYGVMYKSKIVSVVSLIEKKCKFFPRKKAIQIRGMATLKEYQSQGFGTHLLECILKKNFIEKKYDIIWCNARIKAIEFYSNKFFTPVGDVFNINRIGQHKTLYKKII